MDRAFIGLQLRSPANSTTAEHAVEAKMLQSRALQAFAVCTSVCRMQLTKCSVLPAAAA